MVSDHALSCLSTDVKWLIHHVTSLGGGGGGGANDSLVEIFAELDQVSGKRAMSFFCLSGKTVTTDPTRPHLKNRFSTC